MNFDPMILDSSHDVERVDRIRTEAEYESCVARAEALWRAPEESPEFTELQRLVDMIHAYEELD